MAIDGDDAHRHPFLITTARTLTLHVHAHTEAGATLTTAFNSAGAFPLEVRSLILGHRCSQRFGTNGDTQLLVAIFSFLPCEDLVCAGLVCHEVQSPSLVSCTMPLLHVSKLTLLCVYVQRRIKWNVASLDQSLWRVLCMDNLNQVEAPCSDQVATNEKQKQQKKNDDEKQWRECYVAHYLEWRDARASDDYDDEKKQRWHYNLQHSHSFLGSDICQRVHF
jgi:hypothetical protein